MYEYILLEHFIYLIFSSKTMSTHIVIVIMICTNRCAWGLQVGRTHLPARSTISQAAFSPPTQAAQSSSEPVTASSSGLKTLATASRVERARSDELADYERPNWQLGVGTQCSAAADPRTARPCGPLRVRRRDFSRLGESGKALRCV